MSMSMDIRDDELDFSDVGVECDVCHCQRATTTVYDTDGIPWDICDDCLEPVALDDDWYSDSAFVIGGA